MGFWEAVQWWEEWQLRILVLTSLFLQCFLFFAGILRKRCIPSWLRFVIWLAYLGSDAVAIYALATLFNRQRRQEWVSTNEGSPRLQVLWAPILLIHLGGQNGITAYNIEDNELWKRHVLRAASQVTVAVYVFHNSRPEDRRFLAAGVLLFLAGILKCVLKPWDLKRVSINSLVDSCAGSEEFRDGIGNSSRGFPKVISLDEYIQDASLNFREGHGGQQLDILEKKQLDILQYYDVWKLWQPSDVFVDLSPPYWLRLSSLKAMVHNPDKAHGLVRSVLSMTFDRLYTKKSLEFSVTTGPHTSTIDTASFLRFSVIAGSLVIALMVFTLSSTEGYDPTDVKITLILLCLAVAMDYLLPHVISTIKLTGELGKRQARWPDQVAQYNLVGYLARNKKYRMLRRLATLLVCRDYLDQLWCMKPCKSSSNITKLVHGYIAQAWTEHHIKDMATYRAFNDNRGQWTLNREGCGDSLAWSLERPFDESVLLWHLATEFCYHLTATAPSTDETMQRSRVISNYMLYLLFVNPEMLMTGARRFLFREAYRQLKKTLEWSSSQQSDDPDATGPSGHESELARKIAQNTQQCYRYFTEYHSQRFKQFGFIYEAWRLAQHLQNLRVEQEQEQGQGQQDNAAKMWRVVQGVWVEMLCFSAGRCRGYLHAKSLGKGGEYLSYIWLLMSYMGMETSAERMQRTKLKEEDARNNGGSSNGTTRAASSTSSIATGGTAHGMTATILVSAAVGSHGDGTTEASTPTPVTQGGDADESTQVSPPVTTTDHSGDGRSRTTASQVTPSGDESV